MKILVINGPNLNMLELREVGIYGSETYSSLVDKIKDYAKEKKVEVECKQSNSEGEIVTFIQNAYFDKVDGIIINPGAYTHTSIAILDALKSVNIKTVEVHISDLSKREEFSQKSFVSLFVEKRIIGHGLNGYLEAIDYLKGEII